jgi:hypothetical protein
MPSAREGLLNHNQRPLPYLRFIHRGMRVTRRRRSLKSILVNVSFIQTPSLLAFYSRSLLFFSRILAQSSADQSCLAATRSYLDQECHYLPSQDALGMPTNPGNLTMHEGRM